MTTSKQFEATHNYIIRKRYLSGVMFCLVPRFIWLVSSLKLVMQLLQWNCTIVPGTSHQIMYVFFNPSCIVSSESLYYCALYHIKCYFYCTKILDPNHIPVFFVKCLHTRTSSFWHKNVRKYIITTLLNCSRVTEFKETQANKQPD